MRFDGEVRLGMLDDDDVRLLRSAARDVLAAEWGNPADLESADLDALWVTAVDLDWFDLATEEPEAMLALAEECGAVACPLPLADAAVAALLVPDLAPRIAAGEVRIVVAFGAPDAPAYRPLDAAGTASHVLVVGDATAVLRPIAAHRSLPGLARPPWGEITAGPAITMNPVDADALDAARRLLQLGLVARAYGAVAATADEAREHARTRRQFGRVIGAFGAVQQRIATTHIDLAAIRLLLDAAPHSAIDTDLALVTALDRLPDALFAAHHTLAASGYFDEHPAPWRFRRVHADLALCRALGDPAERVARRLLAGAGLPSIPADAAEVRRRDEVRTTLAAHHSSGEPRARLLERAAALGWFSLGWPAALGGLDAPVAEQAAVSEELRYGLAHLDRQLTAQFLIGGSLVRHGSPAQQRDLLPLIAAGSLLVALGYSEAESGSDLASLRTRAVRDGDDWVIDGEKLWSTYADTSTHYWLAVRTDPGAERPQAGITMFLVPMHTPGITVHAITALSGSRSAIVELSGVRVSDTMRVGDLHGGWRVITDALAGERADMGGVAAGLHRGFDDLVAELRRRPDAPVPGRLAVMAARVQAARLLARASVGGSAGAPDALVAPASAVYSGELAEDFGRFAVEVLGPEALLEGGIAAGRFDHALRLSIMYVVGGGTNDVLRGLIARGLGLPRE